jgi:formylglycine-generating enzyme required for sulfatase activity
MGVYPVTQEQWQAVMGGNPSWFSRTGGGNQKVKSISDADLKQFPVEIVSWNHVQEFLKRLNARDKDHGWVYRLPTEAEWECGCRGGATSSEECAFSFYFADPVTKKPILTDNLSSSEVNFNGNYPVGTAPKGPYLERPAKVGSYKPNNLGLYDMHGNVWEWTDTTIEGSDRVDRGGSWRDSGQSCTAAYRDRYAPGNRIYDLGFRLAASPSPV